MSCSLFLTGISKSPRKWLFPHSVLYVTYLLCFMLIAACISLTISYGMLFPNHVVLMWLISASFSFLTSFFLLEPLKVSSPYSENAKTLSSNRCDHYVGISFQAYVDKGYLGQLPAVIQSKLSLVLFNPSFNWNKSSLLASCREVTM